MTAPSGSAMWSARRMASPAAAWSPSASRAIASSRQACASQVVSGTGTAPERTGASATVAACGSSWAIRSAATAMRISPLARPCSLISARSRSARPVSPSRTRACSRSARVRISGQSGASSSLDSRSAAWKAASTSVVAATRQLQQRAHIADRHRRRGLRFRLEGTFGALHPNRCFLATVAARSAPPRALCRRGRRPARRSSRAAGPGRSSAWRALPPARTALTAGWRSTCSAPSR